ncbi:MAG: GNAT family N-acetyltransferase [Bdellovibrionia bacterium]
MQSEILRDNYPPSTSTRGSALRSSMSSKVLGIDWTQYFPYSFETQNCVAEYVTALEGLAFIRKYYNEIHLEQGQFQEQEEGSEEAPFLSYYKEDFTEAKVRYYEELGDFFLVKQGGDPVGVIVGTLTDWSTYNFRSSSFLRKFQGSGIHTKLLAYAIKILKFHGVVRAEADANPSNFATLQVLTRSRFNITGINLSERWGALVHFTQYLQEEPANCFQKHFCSGPKWSKKIRIQKS